MGISLHVVITSSMMMVTIRQAVTSSVDHRRNISSSTAALRGPLRHHLDLRKVITTIKMEGSDRMKIVAAAVLDITGTVNIEIMRAAVEVTKVEVKERIKIGRMEAIGNIANNVIEDRHANRIAEHHRLSSQLTVCFQKNIFEKFLNVFVLIFGKKQEFFFRAIDERTSKIATAATNETAGRNGR